MRTIKISHKNIGAFLLYILLVSTMIQYLGYFIFGIRNNIVVYTLYSNYSFPSINILAVGLRFLKDACICVMGVYSFSRIRKSESLRIIVLSVVLLAWGIIVLRFQGGVMSNLLVGIRTYLYFIVLVLYGSVKEEGELSFKVLYGLVLFGLFFNLVVTLVQAYRGTGGDLSIAGKGGYRFPGLFGGVNGLSGLAIAATLFFVIIGYKYAVNKAWTALLIICSFVISVLGGSRSAMINIVILALLWGIQSIKMNKKMKIQLLIFGACVLVPICIWLISTMIERGSILEVQMKQGRIAILISIFKSSNIFQMIFGHGLGLGSNSDVIYRLNNNLTSGIILDGTFNVVLYQYGLLGISIIMHLLLKVYSNIKKRCDELSLVAFFVTLILQCFTGNMLETYGFLVILFIIYWCLRDERSILKEMKCED